MPTQSEIAESHRERFAVEEFIVACMRRADWPAWARLEAYCDAAVIDVTVPGENLEIEWRVGLTADVVVETVKDHGCAGSASELTELETEWTDDCSWAAEEGARADVRAPSKYSVEAAGPMIVVLNLESGGLETISRERYGYSDREVELAIERIDDVKLHAWTGERLTE